MVYSNPAAIVAQNATYNFLTTSHTDIPILVDLYFQVSALHMYFEILFTVPFLQVCMMQRMMNFRRRGISCTSLHIRICAS
jgi:hypothetical protein